MAVTGKEALPALFDIWDEQLRDIAPDKIALACDRLMKTWRYPNLPLPGDVRGQLSEAEQKGFLLEAEHEWNTARTWIEENYHPDLGFRVKAPKLSPAVLHAIRAAGGFRRIEGCSSDALVWCKKEFIAAYTNLHETGQLENLLSDGEAKTILAGLVAGPSEPERKRFTPVPEPSAPLPPAAEVRAVLDRVAGSATPTPSQEDWESRKDRLKSSALEWAAAQGLSRDSNSMAKTPASATAQVLDSARPEVAISGCKESHVSATEEAGA